MLSMYGLSLLQRWYGLRFFFHSVSRSGLSSFRRSRIFQPSCSVRCCRVDKGRAFNVEQYDGFFDNMFRQKYADKARGHQFVYSA